MVTIGSLLEGGFRLVKERPGAMLIWTLLQLVTTIASSFLVAAILQGNIEALMSGASEASVQMSYLTQSTLVGLAGLVVSTIIYAAVMRAVLRPTEGGPGWLKLGMDEVRLFLLLLLYLLIFVIGLVLIGLLLAVMLGPAGAANLPVVLSLIAIVAGAYFGTKLSLTFPLTLKTKRFAVDDGWRLTKGRFWTLFAAFLIIFVGLFAVGVVIMFATQPDYISAISQYGFGPEAEAASLRHFELLMAGTIDTQIVINWVLTAIQGAVGYALLGGAAATAVQQLTADEEGLSETFS
jgi:hypothetical protein